MSNIKDEFGASIKAADLEARLAAAGINPEDFAELLWPLFHERIIGMLKEMSKRYGTKRQEILTAVIGGLAVKFREPPCSGESAQMCAEMAERLTDAIMKQEERRTGI